MTKQKEIIRTMINTCAIGLTGFGTNLLYSKDNYGFLLIVFGAALEYFKYFGMRKKLW